MHFTNRYFQRLRNLSIKPLPWAILAGALVFLSAIITGGTIYTILKNAYISELRNDLRNTAVALASSVEPDLHEQLRDRNQYNRTLYNQLNRPLAEVMKQSEASITYAYTMRRRGDSLFFVLDGTPAGDANGDGIEDKAELMEFYEHSTPEMFVPFATGKIHIEPAPSCDKWGCFLSAYAPIKDRGGKVIAILGVDMSVEEYQNRMKMVTRVALVLSVIAALLAIGIGFFTYFALFYLRSMFQEAERLARLKGEFLAVMSHEIRTPLNGIIGISHNLDHFIDDPEGHELLKTMQLSGMGLLQIINDILDFSKIESGKMALDPQPTQIMTTCKDIERIFAPDLQKKDLLFIAEIDENVPSHLMVDPLRLRQILTNLVGNAVKFTPECGTIKLRVDWDCNSLHFELSDTGVGIASDKIGELFQPFVQAESGTSRKYGGTGLGLMITRNLIHLMGGRIKCESELGKGTQFIWNIPCNIADVAEVDTPVNPASHSVENRDNGSGAFAGKKVLVVDDQDVNLKVARLMLSKFGIAADVCSSGFEALEMATAREYDLIFLDIQMPEMDGLATYAMMNQEIENFSVPVVALTANVLYEDQMHYQQRGIPYFLAKPILMAELESLLKSVLVRS